MRRAILITIDGWGTNLLGTYGNALCDTPYLDHFSARSIVFDRAYSSSSSLAAVLQSISKGQHPCEPPLPGKVELAEALQTIGKQSIFMTDDPEVASLPWVQSFNESFCFDPDIEESQSQECAKTDWTETRLAMFVETALGELARFCEQPDGLPDWTWLHVSGLSKIWDAPYEYRLRLCDDEDDPEPPRQSEPASFEVNRETDPDTIFGAACGAAAQGKIIDQIWSWIDGFLEEVVDREDCLVILAGTRGYPLGEHKSVGIVREDLYSELIHIPLIVQPGRMPIGTRDNSLVQPMSIWSTLIDWLTVDSDNRQFSDSEVARRPMSKNLVATQTGDAASPRSSQLACLIETANAACLQVPRWSAVWQPKEDAEAMQLPEITRLYLSPDDRWQQNDATSRAHEISETMLEIRQAWLRWLSEGCPQDQRPILPECLTRPV